jgi:integrase
MLLTAIFTGLRASELRGLRWKNVDLKGAKLHVRERADRYLKMGNRNLRPVSVPSRCHR